MTAMLLLFILLGSYAGCALLLLPRLLSHALAGFLFSRSLPELINFFSLQFGLEGDGGWG